MQEPYRILLVCKDGMKVITNSERLFGDKTKLLSVHHTVNGDEFWLYKQTPYGFIYREQ